MRRLRRRSASMRSGVVKRQPCAGTLEQAWQVTRILEGFYQGSGKTIELA